LAAKPASVVSRQPALAAPLQEPAVRPLERVGPALLKPSPEPAWPVAALRHERVTSEVSPALVPELTARPMLSG
jgi:hypothetical protein